VNPIEAYASTLSVDPGNALAFHVRTEPDHSSFQIEIFRQGATAVRVHQATATAEDFFTPDNAYEIGCGWPVAYQLVVPATWAGIYVARFVSTLGATAEVLFVVRSAHSRILVQLGVNTYQAYNNWGGKSLYGFNSTDGREADQVSFDRPLTPDANFFAQWDVDFVRWVESNGFAVDYCTNVDLHANPNLLVGRTLFVSLGHDEYWTKEMRDRLETFIAGGGNVAFLGANVCWWQARLEARTLVCYRDAQQDPVGDRSRVTVRWRDAPLNRTEERMIGVSFATGAFWDGNNGDRPAVDYRVRFPQHWVFGGTGLGYDDGFGASDNIVGYETDAAQFVETDGVPVVTGANGTPRNFIVLAWAALKDWGVGIGQAGMATMGIYRNKGTVFTAGTIEWAKGLQNPDGPVAQITHNVLTQLSQAYPAAIALSNSGFEKGLDPWQVDGDGTATLTPSAKRDGTTGLQVNATVGLTWVTQEFVAEGLSLYQVQGWVKADRPGATLRLQSTQTWQDFAIAQHSGNGQWELIKAVGLVANEGPMFPARVKIQVEKGVIAQIDQVTVSAI
jgi:hypothetical protein